MKNKKMTPVLVILVLLVWGIIIYRVYRGLHDDQDVASFIQTPKKEAYNDYAQPKDTARLQSGYRDPFGSANPYKADTAKAKVASVPVHQPLARPVLPGVNWSALRYLGFIRNPGSKNIVAIVRLNDQELLLSEGQAQAGVHLLKHRQDSILIGYQGQRKYLTIQPPL